MSVISISIAVCVDQNPSMLYEISKGTNVADAVSAAVKKFGTFLSEYIQKYAVAHQIRCQVYLLKFPGDYERVIGLSPDALKDAGSDVQESFPFTSLASVLDTARERIENATNRYVVLLSSGVLEPCEDENKLKTAISVLNAVVGGSTHCYAIGFCSEATSGLDGILDYFTERRITTVQDVENCLNKAQKVAEEIVTQSISHPDECQTGGGEY